MLQRAASNAYSWWVASHIRTKHSKWLEQSLQDMEEKVAFIVKLISEDGDSFAKRAEMYYKKRPELLNFVEESYRAYRALAERFDHISKELQNANSTLASAFPDQFQFAMEDDEEFGGSNQPSRRGGPAYLNSAQNQKGKIPNVPKQFPTKNIKAIIAIAAKSNSAGSGGAKPGKRPGNKAVEALRSGFNKKEAIEEIDKLQKKILTKQTEKEFTKSSYESGVAKYWKIENEITEMQEKVSNLQDEFGVGKAIEDNDARTVMLEAALKSCQQKLAELQEKHERSALEAEEEKERIRSFQEKIQYFKGEPLRSRDRDNAQPEPRTKRKQKVKNPDLDVDGDEVKTTKEIEMLRDKMKEQFDGDSSLSVLDMVEKIDELVNKVIGLESSLSSQTAKVSRMKEESDELQANVQVLDKDTANSNPEKLKEIEMKLKGLQELETSVDKKNSSLETQFTEASSNFDSISEKLPDLNLNLDQEPQPEPQPQPTTSISNKDDTPQEKPTKDQKPEKAKKKKKKEEDEPNWQKMFNEELDKEKALRNEYISVLQSFEEVKKKLGEIEDKSAGSVTELEELKNANAKKDEELQSLRDQLIKTDSTVQSYEQVKKKLGEVEHKSEDSEAELTHLRDVNAKKDEEIQSLREQVKKKLGEVEHKGEDSEAELTNLRDANAKKDEEIQALREQMKKKLGEVEHKTEDSEAELTHLRDVNAKKDEEIESLREQLLKRDSTVQVKEIDKSEDELTQLRDANAKKDEEIQTLREKLGFQNEHNSVIENQEELNELREANEKKDEEIKSLRDKLVILQKKLEDYKKMKEAVDSDDETPPQACNTDGDDYLLKMMQLQQTRAMSPVEARLRADIDEILEENLDFWMRFSSSFSELQKFHSQVEDLQQDLAKIEESKPRRDSNGDMGPSLKSDSRAIYKHFKEIQTDLTVWMERSMTLKDELQCRFSQLCHIQEQITQALNDGAIHDEMQFTSYQAAKFQGEVLNMQQENNKVADELQASLDNVTTLQIEVEKIVNKLNEDLGMSGSRMIQVSGGGGGDSVNKNQVPLRSFIFGVKPKKQKQSMFFSVPPSLHKKYQQLKS